MIDVRSLLIRRGARLGAIAIIALGAAFLWLAGLLVFVRAIPEEAVVSDTATDTATDAIVVLTGASGRLAVGLQLLADKRARKLFVSGVHRGVDVNSLLDLARKTPEDFACCVEVGHEADNTTGNALETAAWMRRNGFASLRLVTSSYHLPRALLEFRQAMPGTRVVAHPVFAESFKREQWWAWPGTAALIASEYNKWLAAYARHRLAGAATLLGLEG